MTFTAWTLTTRHGFALFNVPTKHPRKSDYQAPGYNKQAFLLFGNKTQAESLSLHLTPHCCLSNLGEQTRCGNVDLMFLKRPVRDPREWYGLGKFDEDTFNDTLFRNLISTYAVILLVDNYVIRNGVIKISGVYYDPGRHLSRRLKRGYIIDYLNGVLDI